MYYNTVQFYIIFKIHTKLKLIVFDWSFHILNLIYKLLLVKSDTISEIG